MIKTILELVYIKKATNMPTRTTTGDFSFNYD